MRNYWRPLFLVVLSCLGLYLFSAGSVPKAHGVGQVFISPSAIPTSSTGSTVTLQVQVSNVDPFTGWDVEIRTDESILNPTGISIDGNLLTANFGASMFLVADCVNGQGTGCGSEDGLGVVHSAASALGSKSVPPGPTSGLLFTVTYTALNGGSGDSLVEIIRQVIANGVTGSIINVSVANAVYGSGQDFGIQLTPLFGNVMQGGETMVNATILSFNGFSGSINLSANSVLSAYAVPTTVFLQPDGSVTAEMFASTTLCDVPSSYSLAMVAVSGSVSHEVRAFPNLEPNTGGNPDFCMIRFETSASVRQGSQITIRFLLSSHNKFNGTVSMSVSVLPALSNGPSVALKSNSVTMYPGGFGDGEIQVSTTLGTSLGDYTIIVNANSGKTSHFLTETLSVIMPAPTFSISASSPNITVAPGSSTTDTISLKSLFGFNDTVALGTAIQPFIATGPSISLSVYTFRLASTVNSTLTVVAPMKAQIGNYSVMVFADGGGIRSSVNVTVDVTPLDPPYFTSLQWDHRVSVGKGGVETFNIGLHNPNKNTIFLQIQVLMIDSSGTPLALSTGMLQANSEQTFAGIALTATFSPTDIGSTFSFVATIMWGTSSSNLSITGSARAGTPTSGIFTIVV